MGHRGRKSDPLYRSRQLLTEAATHVDDHGKTNLLGLLDAGDQNGEVVGVWSAKEAVRAINISL